MFSSELKGWIKNFLQSGRPFLFVFLILSVPLLIYAYIGFFSRYMADDYSLVVYLRTLGFWKTQTYWYQAWSGRYTFTFVVSLAELIGIGIVPYLPSTALLLWGFGLNWALSQLLGGISLVYSRYIRWSLVALILFVTLRSQLFLSQVLFWQTGLLTYLLPLILYIFTFGWFLRRINRITSKNVTLLEWIAWVVWIFIVGGFSETSLILQFGVFLLGGIYFAVRPGGQGKRAGLLLIAGGMIGSFVALGITAGSPGNAVRSPGFPPQVDLLDLLSGSLEIMLSFLSQWFASRIRLVACSVAIPALIALIDLPQIRQVFSIKKLLRGMLFVFAACFLLVWINFIPAYYVWQAGPPFRAMVLAQFILTMWAAATGYIGAALVGLFLLRRSQKMLTLPIRLGFMGIFFVLLWVGPVESAKNLMTMIPEMRSFAVQWDARDRFIREERLKGVLDIEVPVLRDLSKLGDVRSEPEFWINQAVANYYGLNSIIAKDTLTIPP